jgi:hypothetical protein
MRVGPLPVINRGDAARIGEGQMPIRTGALALTVMRTKFS